MDLFLLKKQSSEIVFLLVRKKSLIVKTNVPVQLAHWINAKIYDSHPSLEQIDHLGKLLFEDWLNYLVQLEKNKRLNQKSPLFSPPELSLLHLMYNLYS